MSTPMSNDVGDVYIPQVMSFADSGISELVLTDEFHIYGEVNAVIVIRDAERRIVGFQWFTKDIENAGEKRAEQIVTALTSQAAEIAELRTLICDLFAPDGHRDGCLYKDNHNFPCQCDWQERWESYRKAVEAAKVLAALTRKEG